MQIRTWALTRSSSRWEMGGRDGGAQHVEPVQGGFLVDLGLVAGNGQRGVGDGDAEVLAGLVFADHLADGHADLARAGQPSSLDAGDDGASSFSVAASSSSRVRARSAASRGLRQAISRSPGKSGEVI